MIRISALLLSAWCLAQAQPPAPGRLYPVDETARDPSFRSYIGRLRSAVEKRDSEALRKLVDQDVIVGSSDEDKGWTKFVERWRLDERADSMVWGALSDLLSLGFIREHPSLYVSPYLVWRFPRDLDRAAHLVVIRDKVALRAAPSPNAPAVASLSFDIVRRLGPPQRGEGLGQWFQVRTLDGHTGFVATRDVMSPLMPRAQFERIRGRWRLMALEGEYPPDAGVQR